MEVNVFKKEVGARIKNQRKDMQITRSELAKRMNISELTIKSWEQGVSNPKLPDLLSLGSILNIPIGVLLGEGDVMNKEEKLEKDLLGVLEIKDEKAAKPVIYKGIEEIVAGWIPFWKDYDLAIDASWEAYGDVDPDWPKENVFIILIDSVNGDVIAIRDFGKYLPKVEDFLFVTKYIPIFTHQPMTEDKLEEHISHIKELFLKEKESMNHIDKKPLFLISYHGTNNYIAWSLKENKYICIYDYKEYRDMFRVSEYEARNEIDIRTNDGEYVIVPPSRELISLLGLNLRPSVWERKQIWDVWEERTAKQLLVLGEEYENDTYKEAIRIINKGRKTDYGLDDEFVLIEDRVYRYERLCTLGAPKKIIEKEIKLMKKSINEINQIIDR